MPIRLLKGDCREVLRTLPAESVHCVVTSPPYFGLRDYGVAGQIGLETTPEAFTAELVKVFAELRRVLRKDGTAWLNLGDSYSALGARSNNNGSGATGLKRDGRDEESRLRSVAKTKTLGMSLPPIDTGLKPKDLLGIPWRVAFALQADGWYLRQDIIWSKPNPMPESVTDRCTKAHEYIFLLSKSPRYFYDADAIREPYALSTLREFEEGYEGKSAKDYAGSGAQDPSDVKRRMTEKAKMRAAGTGYYRPNGENGTRGVAAFGDGANKRSVWTVTTQPYAGAHFATFPEALIEPCILAGSKPGDLVLDPFTGSGTTGAVAIRHQRQFVGIELNADYVQLARQRIGAVAPLFSSEIGEHTA